MQADLGDSRKWDRRRRVICERSGWAPGAGMHRAAPRANKMEPEAELVAAAKGPQGGGGLPPSALPLAVWLHPWRLGCAFLLFITVPEISIPSADIIHYQAYARQHWAPSARLNKTWSRASRESIARSLFTR